jgi:hypothetical protein
MQSAAELIGQTLRPLARRRLRTREPISAETVETMERRLEVHVFLHIGASGHLRREVTVPAI